MALVFGSVHYRRLQRHIAVLMLETIYIPYGYGKWSHSGNTFPLFIILLDQLATSQMISVSQPVCESAWLCVCVLTRVAHMYPDIFPWSYFSGCLVPRTFLAEIFFKQIPSPENSLLTQTAGCLLNDVPFAIVFAVNSCKKMRILCRLLLARSFALCSIRSSNHWQRHCLSSS